MSVFYYNGSNSLKNASKDACKLGLKNPPVFLWGHGHPRGLLLGNPGFPGYDGTKKDGTNEESSDGNDANFNSLGGAIAQLGPSQTTILACNFMGIPPTNYVQPPVLPGLPLLSSLANTTGAPATALVGNEAPTLVGGVWGWYLQNGGYTVTAK